MQPGRSGCLGRARRGSPRAVARVCVPLRQPKLHHSILDLHLNEPKIRVSRSEDCSEPPGTPRPVGRRLAQILDSQFTLAVAG